MIRSFLYLSFFAMLLLFGCNGKDKLSPAEASTNDSIAKYLKLAGSDSLSFEERDKWNEKALSLIDLKKNDSVVRWYLAESSKYFNKTKNNLYYLKFSRIHFIKSEEVNDSLNLARYHRYKAAYHKKITMKYDSAFYHYLKSEKIYKELKDYDGYSNVLLNKGILQYNIDDYFGADLSLSSAYIIAKKRKDYRKMYGILNQLGLVSTQLSDYDKAISYLKSALEIIKDNKLQSKEHEEQVCLSNLGLVYLNMDDYRQAILYFEQSLLNKKVKYDHPILYANIIDNLGFCKLQLGKIYSPTIFYESLKIRDSLKSPDLIMSYINLTRFYEKRNPSKSISYSRKALKVGKSSNSKYYYLNALKIAGNVDKMKAAEYLTEYYEKSDSIQLEERKTRNQFFKIQLETDEITQEKETAIKQKWIVISIITTLLLIVILLFVIYLQRAKQKELSLIQIQQKSNEEIYQLMLNQHLKVEEARQKEKRRIALELHDGIMNRLASTRLNLFVLSKKTDQVTINNCLKYIGDIHQIENEIRNISHDLNQELFQEKDSFVTLLTQFIREQNSLSKSKYELQIESIINWESISSEIKMHIFRIIQEASYNCNKYANATRVIISFTLDDINLCVSISDDGDGFDTEKEKDGIGLKNIQQRIKTLNGFFSIKSSNSGTTLYFMIPFKK